MADLTGGAQQEAIASGMRQEMQQNCTETAVQTVDPARGSGTSWQVRAISADPGTGRKISSLPTDQKVGGSNPSGRTLC